MAAVLVVSLRLPLRTQGTLSHLGGKQTLGHPNFHFQEGLRASLAGRQEGP